MIVDINLPSEENRDSDEQSVFDLQELFGSSQNHEYDCPFCKQRVYIILSENTLIGDQQMMDYTKTMQDFLYKSTAAAIGSECYKSASKSNEDSLQDNHDISDSYQDEYGTLKKDRHQFSAQIIETKVQRLKNTTKLAKVLIIEESDNKYQESAQYQSPLRSQQSEPIRKQKSNLQLKSMQIKDTKDEQVQSIKQLSKKRKQPQQCNAVSDFTSQVNQLSPNKSFAKIDRNQSIISIGTDNLQQTKTLRYYPEGNHTPSEEECQKFNARTMRHLMKEKMIKNPSFIQSQIILQSNGANRLAQQAPKIATIKRQISVSKQQ